MPIRYGRVPGGLPQSEGVYISFVSGHEQSRFEPVTWLEVEGSGVNRCSMRTVQGMERQAGKSNVYSYILKTTLKRQTGKKSQVS